MSKMIEFFVDADAKPAATLQPLAFDDLESGPGAGEPLVHGKHALKDVKVQLVVRVGSIRLTVGELLATRADAVLRLDRAVGDPVDLLVEGQVVARGELVAVDDCFGVRITELPIGLPA